jgi:hypothetical protein
MDAVKGCTHDAPGIAGPFARREKAGMGNGLSVTPAQNSQRRRGSRFDAYQCRIAGNEPSHALIEMGQGPT